MMNEIRKYRDPYGEPDLTALRDRIRRQTTLRPEPTTAQPSRRLAVAFAAAALVALTIGLCFTLRHDKPATPDLEQLLSTAPTETLQQAAASNYDDIIANQQL